MSEHQSPAQTPTAALSEPLSGQIALPYKMTRNFAQPARHRVFYGGRGSGKTRNLAMAAAIRGYQLAYQGRKGVILASREHLGSLEESSMHEIKQAIASLPWLAAGYDMGEKYIRTCNGHVRFVFSGLRHNLDSIKSKSQILLNWTDEAETVSEVAWSKLMPTLREPGVENWVSFNPESPDSATWRRWVADPPADCVVTQINWRDNPWFTKALNAQRLDDKRKRPETYDHVWEGEFLTLTDAQVFAGHWEIAAFEPREDWDGPYYGLDFGFARDPTAAVECWVGDGRLYIRREAGRIGLELDDTAAFVTAAMPDMAKHVVRADSARPESISYLKRHGLPRIEGASKWAGSVEDGVAFIKSFDKIVVHPECPATAREMRLYSYQVDRLTGDVKPKIVDAHNHYVDASRYALAAMIRHRGVAGMLVKKRHKRMA